MEWIKVDILTTTWGIEPVTATLLDNGITGIQIEDDNQLKQYLNTNSDDWDYVEESLLNKPIGETKIIVYVSDNPYGNEMLMNIKSAIANLRAIDTGVDLGSLVIKTESNLNDEQWLNKWKDYYKPFKVGNRIMIKPVWEECDAADDRVIFNINPGHVFGTGLHQTTQLCMLELEKYINEDSIVADLGCGSGILSIIALLLGAKSAFAVDIDANAIKIAYENAELSNVDKNKYYVTSGNVIDDKALQDEIGYNKYDVVVANIIADVICAISDIVNKELKSGGIFIASGIIKDRVEDVYDALKNAGLSIISTNIKDEWVCITSKKE